MADIILTFVIPFEIDRSAIIHPTDKQVVVHDGKITLDGWAYSGGGNWVERVEVSPDGLVIDSEHIF